MKTRMHNNIFFIALVSSLSVSIGVHANDNPAQHSADCVTKSTLAYGIMENRLDGTTKSQVRIPDDPAISNEEKQLMEEVVEKTYTYNIENGSADDFQDQILEECMSEK